VSSITWTPAAVASEQRRWHGAIWRAVEAQHRVSTLRLVDTLHEQALLESLLEQSKPAMPRMRAPRHYLISTPFRYPSPCPGGSRFRAATDPGVFYGADERRTACAELGYWRWRFLMDSPALLRLESLPQTLFQIEVDARSIDLTAQSFEPDAHLWASPDNYRPCQQLAQTARAAQVQAIRYRSVRDPQHALCTAVLTPESLAATPVAEQTWRLAVTRARIQWQRDSALHEESFEFEAAYNS
jgi:hypothetical protein